MLRCLGGIGPGYAPPRRAQTINGIVPGLSDARERAIGPTRVLKRVHADLHTLGDALAQALRWFAMP